MDKAAPSCIKYMCNFACAQSMMYFINVKSRGFDGIEINKTSMIYTILPVVDWNMDKVMSFKIVIKNKNTIVKYIGQPINLSIIFFISTDCSKCNRIFITSIECHEIFPLSYSTNIPEERNRKPT